MRVGSERWAAGGLVVAGAAALGAAFAAEWVLGLVPCALCLWERWPYRLVIATGLVALIVPRFASRLLLGVSGLLILVGAGLAAVHVGVELGWWPSPLPECAAPRFGGGSITERLARMPARPAKPCDEPTYLVPFVPLSMAWMNLLFALAVAAGLAMWGWSHRRAT